MNRPRVRLSRRFERLSLGIVALIFLATESLAEPFALRIVDAETGRGVPLVELRTVHALTFVTDSNGFAAIDEPDLLGRKVFFNISSHGYEFPQDGFGIRGTAVDVSPGGEVVLKINRINLAERLYRVTGAGIYRDSVKLGRAVPLDRPVMNALVTGQDSVQAIPHAGRLHWFWGDTNRLAYPLGQYWTSGAISPLPGNGGLDPADGVNLDYFTDESGFSRPMFARPESGVFWIDGVFSIPDDNGHPRLVTHYSHRQDLATEIGHGLAVYDEERNLFRILREFDELVRLWPRGQAFRATDQGTEYIYFSTPYPLTRVPASWTAIQDPGRYEAFTPLQPGADLDLDALRLERDDRGQLIYAWKANTATVEALPHHHLEQKDIISERENRLRTVDTVEGHSLVLHGGSVRWNPFRKRWIMIAVQASGSASYLGEVWYSEATAPEGPYDRAVKIVTHDRYSFYNPTHHDFFDQEGGRLIYFEGTYTHAFSRADAPTPRYDYNQIMYQLDLSDARLKPAFVD